MMIRKGFTLVELLIVIVVIGILSAMMFLSSTEAVTTAKVSNVIANMRQLKTAALEWYMDHIDYVDPTDFTVTYPVLYHEKIDKRNKSVKNIQNLEKTGSSYKGEITRYIDGGFSINDGTTGTYAKAGGGYAIIDCGPFGFAKGKDDSEKRSRWFVLYDAPDDKRIRQKLAGRAKTTGLLNNTNLGYYTGANQYVLMEIINFSN